MLLLICRTDAVPAFLRKDGTVSTVFPALSDPPDERAPEHIIYFAQPVDDAMFLSWQNYVYCAWFSDESKRLRLRGPPLVEPFIICQKSRLARRPTVNRLQECPTLESQDSLCITALWGFLDIDCDVSDRHVGQGRKGEAAPLSQS